MLVADVQAQYSDMKRLMVMWGFFLHLVVSFIMLCAHLLIAVCSLAVHLIVVIFTFLFHLIF